MCHIPGLGTAPAFDVFNDTLQLRDGDPTLHFVTDGIAIATKVQVMEVLTWRRLRAHKAASVEAGLPLFCG